MLLDIVELMAQPCCLFGNVLAAYDASFGNRQARALRSCCDHSISTPCQAQELRSTLACPSRVQAEGMQEGFRHQLAEIGRLQQASLAKGHRQEAALQQARQETLEAVQQGNHKYATMLAERMGIEDELKHQLASKQHAAAARSAASACDDSKVVQEPDTMHVVTHMLTTIAQQLCIRFVKHVGNLCAWV